MKYNKRRQRKKMSSFTSYFIQTNTLIFLKWLQYIELDNNFLKISSNQTASYEIKKINHANELIFSNYFNPPA